jgi:hypothetical protein
MELQKCHVNHVTCADGLLTHYEGIGDMRHMAWPFGGRGRELGHMIGARKMMIMAKYIHTTVYSQCILPRLVM